MFDWGGSDAGSLKNAIVNLFNVNKVKIPIRKYCLKLISYQPIRIVQVLILEKILVLWLSWKLINKLKIHCFNHRVELEVKKVILESSFKACVRYFYQISIFSPNDSPSKTMKNAFYFIKKALFSLEIIEFFYFCSSLFFSLSAIALKDDER